MHKIISPIAIDMGAKNTGVYYAKYKQGTTFEQINKHGQVLVYGNYTPLLKTRTANRHVRRSYQRKKLAKRLLTVILKEYFKFPAEKHAQAIGFLMNRRGFSFLEEEYSKDYLNSLPDEVWDKLSDEVKDYFDGQENIADQLMSIANNEHTKITQIFEAIQNIKNYKEFNQNATEIKKEFVYFDYVEKIDKACELILKDESITDEKVAKSAKDKQKLSKVSNWIIERLNKEQNLNLTTKKEEGQTDLIPQITPVNVEKLQKKLPNFKEEIKKVNARKKENNKSDWNFKYESFELDKKEDDLSFNINDVEDIKKKDKEKKQQAHKTHLHHFCYAVYKINNEIISGGRHRSKFFDEIKEDLAKFNDDDFLNDKHSPKYLVNFIQAINNTDLNINKLHKLVCHISNFELKPLRKYFNNENYKNGNDKFDDKKLSRLASTWFMKNWIVSKEKDKKDKVEDYKKLRQQWKEHLNKDNIIDFWLATDPKLTIPPYQAMLNRRPPKCQSLLLNSDYLNKHYPDWKNWLSLLKIDTDYQEKLEDLQSRKGARKTKNGKNIDGRRLIDDEKIELRQLQLILDKAKKRDDFKSNEIWSIYHQWQKPETKDKKKLINKLDKVIKKSTLPDDLKQDLLSFDKFDKAHSFGHFLNKYYQTRRKARNGRYFLIQEKKGKWLTNGKLLTLCTHKPQQKKHQWQTDLAMVLGTSKDDLIKKIGNEPEIYFKEIKGFSDNCKEAAKAQKDHRGELKLKIYSELVGKPKGDLAKLANKCHNLKIKLVENTGIKDIFLDKQTNELNQKIALVFKFAQIHNIVFKDRSGFSKTCPVCSTDNGFRMQGNDKGIATASRLPALSVRLIDGVVMRICDAIARKVAVTKWNDIQNDLENDNKVSIPLILEQNRFEFEPSLAKIKGQKVKEDEKNKTVTIHTAKGQVKLTDDRDKEFNKKEDRIRGAVQGICAYNGGKLGTDGEIDHIIPQASKYETLNDEANLIYVSKQANQGKTNQTYHLQDLNTEYKNKIFGNKSDDEIKGFIYDELEGKEDNGDSKIPEDVDKEDNNFIFGRYLSFINLNVKQKKAFRHALFLPDNDPLKQKVIQSLQNRNRTIVNGTQRYLAQCIADKIHRIARNNDKKNKTNFANKIEFDYFEYSARWDDPKSTYNLRKEYGIDKPKKQPLYSHLIDAQMAFLLAAEDHKNSGSMGIKFADNQTIWQGEVDKNTGEVLPSKIFNFITVNEKTFENIDLDRKKSKTGTRLHRSFHRPNFYAQNYVPLFFGKKDDNIEVKSGFSWENSVSISTTRKNISNILSILQFAKNNKVANSEFHSLKDLYDSFNKKTKCDDYEIFYIDWDKTKIQKYLVENYSNKDIVKGKQWGDEIQFLSKLSYKVQKQKIEKLQDIQDVLSDKETGKGKINKYFSIKIFNGEIELPAKQEWLNLSKTWKNEAFNLKDYFAKKGTQKNSHQKVRKIFSLPVVNNLGHFLQKRKSWNGQDIYQISPDSDSRYDGNKFSRLVLTKKGDLKEVINKPFASKNTFKLKDETLYTNSDYLNIDPNKWLEIENNNDFPKGVSRIAYRIDNKTRPQLKIHLLDYFDLNQILENPLTKAKEKQALKTKLEDKNTPDFIKYTASGFNKEITKKLLEALSNNNA